MKRICQKLRAVRGETLIEVLVAVLILSLAAGLFAALYTASTNINMAAREEDKAFYNALENLEGRLAGKDTGETPSDSVVKITDATPGEDRGKDLGSVNVDVYTEDGMKVYVDKEASGS